MRKTRCAGSAECSRGDGSAHGAPKMISRRHAWCGAMVPWVGAGILFFGAGLTAQAQDFIPTPQCTTSGQTVTCEGDLSYLELSEDNYTTLRVENLTQDLAPPAGTEGITFHSSNDDINLDINTGENSIRTSGSASEGIDASSGGNVTVDVMGHITTTGSDSQGIKAYSDGAGEVMVAMTGDITTEGFEDSEGIYAQSTGDAKVMVDVTGNIETKGESSEGIYARSENGALKVTVKNGDITTEGEGSEGIYARSTGDAPVTIDVTGNIRTKGIDSEGIDVENHGAGVVGVTVTGDITTEGIEGSEGIIARSNGAGEAMITVTGDITTKGRVSEGIDVQSSDIGPITVTMTGDIVTEGANSEGVIARSNGAGEVMITVTGDITTKGRVSEGIDVRSVDENDPSGGGAVTIAVVGDITTEGEDSEGIFAQSNGNIDITLKGGAEGSTIASAEDRGVEFRGGMANTLTIYDTVTISGALFDVRGSDGNETINNYGTLTALGIIDLGDGVNAFNNRVDAAFHSGREIDLGAGNTFTNWGELSPGGANGVQHTTLIGNFVNQPEGTLIVTVNPETGRSDKLSVTGTATLQGSMLKVAGITYADDRTYTILETTDGVTGRFDDVADTLFIDNRLSYDADSVALSLISKGDEFDDFAETANQETVARSLDHLSITDDLPQAVLALTTKQDAQAAYEALAGEVHASLNGALLDTGQRPVAVITRHLTARAGWWMTGYGTWGDTDATSNTAQMDTELGGVLLGFDHSLSERWRLGILGGYSHTRVTQRARASAGSADTLLVGLYGEAETGVLSLCFGTIYNGHYSLEADRAVRFTGFSERLSASYSAWSWQLFAEAGYPMQGRNLGLEPFVGVSSIRLKTKGFNETGGTTALTASSETNSRTFTTLGVRGALELTDRLQARGLVGWRHAFDDIDPSSTFRLAGGSAFTVEGAPTARNAAVAEFGFEDRLSDQAVLSLAYHGRYGDGVSDYGVNAGLKVTF